MSVASWQHECSLKGADNLRRLKPPRPQSFYFAHILLGSVTICGHLVQPAVVEMYMRVQLLIKVMLRLVSVAKFFLAHGLPILLG